VIGPSAIWLCRYLGPGLLESAYEKCLAHELKLAGRPFIGQTPTAFPLSALAVLFVKISFVTQLMRYFTDTGSMYFNKEGGEINKESGENREGEKPLLPNRSSAVLLRYIEPSASYQLAEAPVVLNEKLLKDGIRSLLPSPSLLSLSSL
jgi:hypothetical protein